ncbi:TIGR03915 family putative DNA repair protein [Clostridium sp. JNZ X4-2]
MSVKSDIIYKYDGSFEGLMCCVFESYYKGEIPGDIISPLQLQTTFFPTREIETDLRKSSRVIESIPKKIDVSALDFIKYAFLTCMPQKEMYIFLFLRKGYYYGSPVMEMLADDIVSRLFKAVKYLKRESHLIKGFLRFSVFKESLVAQIQPKNYVLPLIMKHFCERYPGEYFFIYDKTHYMALVYNTHKPAIIPVDDLQMPQPDEKEKYYRKLWTLFYNTVEIKQRRNLKCRMSNMPKRYWKYMTEFSSQ